MKVHGLQKILKMTTGHTLFMKDAVQKAALLMVEATARYIHISEMARQRSIIYICVETSNGSTIRKAVTWGT